MKRIALALFLAGCIVPLAKAQDHFQAGAYVDYFRISQTKTNQAGLGARAAFKAFPHVMLEGEMNYDFGRVFTEGFTDNSTVPPTVTFQRTNLKVLHGLFGPKFVAGHGAIRPFVTLKGGFVNFRLDPGPATAGAFVSSVENLRAKNVSGALYPGGGLEGHVGPVGLRLDVGDEMYFDSGTHHNLRVAFGPFIRF
jgi:hypothetical protein